MTVSHQIEAVERELDVALKEMNDLLKRYNIPKEHLTKAFTLVSQAKSNLESIRREL